MSHEWMARRRVLALSLGGIAGLGAQTLIGGRKAMAQVTPETVVYVSNAGSKEVFALAMNRATGALDLIEKTPVPGTDKPSPASLPMATSPDRRFLYAQLRSEPYPVSTFAIDRTTGPAQAHGGNPAGRPDGIHQHRPHRQISARRLLRRRQAGDLPDQRTGNRRGESDTDPRHQAQGALRGHRCRQQERLRYGARW